MMSVRSGFRTLAAASMLALGLASSATASPIPPHYTVTDLWTLGGPDSVGNGINDAGQVVGNSTLPTGRRHAFFWSAGLMKDLGALAGDQSDASRLNNLGTPRAGRRTWRGTGGRSCGPTASSRSCRAPRARRETSTISTGRLAGRVAGQRSGPTASRSMGFWGTFPQGGLTRIRGR